MEHNECDTEQYDIDFSFMFSCVFLLLLFCIQSFSRPQIALSFACEKMHRFILISRFSNYYVTNLPNNFELFTSLVSTIFFLLNKIFCIRMNTEQVFADRRLLRKCPDWRFSFRLNVSCKFKPVPKRFVAVTLVMFVVFYGQVCLSALSALQCDGVGEEKSTDFPVKSMN